MWALETTETPTIGTWTARGLLWMVSKSNQENPTRQNLEVIKITLTGISLSVSLQCSDCKCPPEFNTFKCKYRPYISVCLICSLHLADFGGKWKRILIRLGIGNISEGPDGRLTIHQGTDLICFVLPKVRRAVVVSNKCNFPRRAWFNHATRLSVKTVKDS